MPRDYRVYLEDILEAIEKIGRYTAGFSCDTLAGDGKTLDAVARIWKSPGKQSSICLTKSATPIPKSNGSGSPVCETFSFTPTLASMSRSSGISSRTSARS